MSDFRDRYDTAAVSGRISQPPFDELARRGRRRASRTRTVRLAGVAVVAALAATSLLVLPDQTGPDIPAASPPPSPALGGPWHLTFLTVDHGIATNWDETTCTFSLFVTDDGGSTWSEPREVPEFPGREHIEAGSPWSEPRRVPEPPDRVRIGAERYCLHPHVKPVAPDTLVIPLDARIEHEYVSLDLEPPTTSYLSHDAGRTWQEYEPEIRTAETVPDGVVPDVHCEAYIQPGEYDSPHNDFCVGQPRVSWYDPQTGDQMVLRNNPQAEMYHPVVGGDGSIWAGGHDPDGNPHISVSRDRGRTWQDVSPPPVEDVDVDVPRMAAVAAADSATAYFFSWTESTGPVQRDELYRTTDGGETWQLLPAAQQFVPVAGMWVVDDGALLVREMPATPTASAGENLVYHLSRDGGDTFEEVDLPVAPGVPVSGGFYGLGYDADAGTTRAVSEDGLTWREFDLPEFQLPPEPTP